LNCKAYLISSLISPYFSQLLFADSFLACHSYGDYQNKPLPMVMMMNHGDVRYGVERHATKQGIEGK
jgi:hypothetical protein